MLILLIELMVLNYKKLTNFFHLICPKKVNFLSVFTIHTVDSLFLFSCLVELGYPHLLVKGEFIGNMRLVFHLGSIVIIRLESKILYELVKFLTYT